MGSEIRSCVGLEKKMGIKAQKEASFLGSEKREYV